MCIIMEPERRLIGYTRVSTEEQETRMQRDALIKFGVKSEHIYEEKASGKTMNRPVWNRIMKFMREGDTVVFWKLDRLGRDLIGILDTVAFMEKKGVHFVSITEKLDTDSAMGKFIFHLFAALAQLERGIIAERTTAGIAAKRKSGGKTWGRRSPIETSPIRKACMVQYLSIPQDRQITANELLRWINALPEPNPKVKKIDSAETLRRWIRLNRKSSDGDEKLFRKNHPSLCN